MNDLGANSSLDDPVAGLIARVLDGRLDDSERIELLSRLHADVAARQRYLDHLLLHAMLGKELTNLSSDVLGSLEVGLPALPQQVVAVPRRMISPLATACSITLVAALFYGAFIVLSHNLRDKQNLAERNAQSTGEPVATIRETSDVEWSNEKSEIPNRKSQISAGQPLSIQSGLVELQLKQGTTLLIEGPADWKIDGDNSATLTHGKLVARVPQQAIGFTLETPTAKIIDLGTEFGVQVQDSGDTIIEVLRGVVDSTGLAGGDSTPSGRAPIRLKAGEAIQYEAGRAPAKRIAADETRFSRLYGKAVEAEDAYAKTVLADRPLAYWRLSDGLKEQAQDASGNNYHGSYSGALIPNQPGPLSTSADRSIRLQGAAAEGWMTVKHLPLGPSFTIELWAKSATSKWNAYGWLGSARTPNGLIVHPFANSRAWQGYVFNGRDGEQLHEIGKHEPARIDDRFHHYAVSYDDATDTGRMYFDGKQVAERVSLLGTNKRLAGTDVTLLLGYDPGASGPKLGDGWIDEMAVFDRVLSEAEIRAHYDAVQAVAAESDRG